MHGGEIAGVEHRARFPAQGLWIAARAWPSIPRPTIRKLLLTISQSLAANIAVTHYLRTRMFSSILPSTVAGQAMLLAGLCGAALACVVFLYRRMCAQNHPLPNALDN